MSFSRAGNEIETSFQDRNSVNVNTTSFVSMKKRCVECSYVPGTKFCRIQVPLVFDDNQGDFVKSTSGRIVDQATNGVDSPPYSATSPAYYPPSPIYNAALIKDSSCNATSFAYYPVSPSYTVAPTEAPKSPPYSATSPAYYPPSPIYTTVPTKDSKSPSCNATSFAYYPVSPSYAAGSTEDPKYPPYRATSPAYYPVSPSYTATNKNVDQAVSCEKAPIASTNSPSYYPLSPSYIDTSSTAWYEPLSPLYNPPSPSNMISYSATSPEHYSSFSTNVDERNRERFFIQQFYPELVPEIPDDPSV